MKDMIINELQQNLQNKAQYLFVNESGEFALPCFLLKESKRTCIYRKKAVSLHAKLHLL